MRIYYRLVNGHHVTASAQPSCGELTPEQRELLCEVFASLTRQREEHAEEPMPPQQIGYYVRIRVGVEGEHCFAEYSPRYTS